MPLSESQQIDLLCRIATTVTLPVFHERVGDQVYRIAKRGSQIQIDPIADRHNQAVGQAFDRLRRSLPRPLLDWLTVPLLLPVAQRGLADWSIADSPIDGWKVKPLRDGINTVAWLKQEARDNQTDRPTGYTAQIGSRLRGQVRGQSCSEGSDQSCNGDGGAPFVELEERYSRLLECMQYCDRFKFIVSVYPVSLSNSPDWSVPSVSPVDPCP
jgi:hypothetical protein